MMVEGLKILVVGDDRTREVTLNSQVVNDVLTRGYRPQILSMDLGEWTLRSVEGYVDCLSAVAASTRPGAQQKLNSDAYLPISHPNPKYLFNAHEVHQALGHPTNEASARALAAHQIIQNYLHNPENPLMAVVLSDLAFAWRDVRKVWLNQLPPETDVWCIHDHSDTPTRVRFDAEAQPLRLV